ncbi:hypothetical protein WA588_001265 [Blastocystis sp. NMH]
MRVNEYSNVYDMDWEHVTSAFWKKYWHPNCSHSRTYVLNRTIDEKGRLVTKRLHVISQKLPYFIRCIFGDIVTYGGEESIIDPKEKALQIRSKNLSFTRQATVLDTSSYTVCADDPSKTLYVKSTTTYGSTASILNNQIEKWYAYNEGHHFKKGVDVINDILFGRVVIDYGVTPDEPEQNPAA